jgi:predicted dehydrogenase
VINLGMLDFDTSHCVEFTRRLNHEKIDRAQWVDGARVVLGCPGRSQIFPELIPRYRQEVEGLGVRLVEKPEEMIGKVDGMLIESQEGGVHLERARPFLEAGVPCFVDKPFTCSTADARELAALAARRQVPVFSSSSLRYAPEVVRFLADPAHGKVVGAFTYGPASLHPRNPGWFHYGIHAVELLYTLMGPGCERVACTHEKDADVVTGQWKDGRLASVRGIRGGGAAFGATVFTERGVTHLAVAATFIYRELLKQVVGMFQTKRPPLDVGVTIEIVAFIEAALRSAHNHGAGDRVAV